MKKYSIAFIALIQLAVLSCRTNGNQDSRAMDADKNDTTPFLRKDSIKTRLDKIPEGSEAKTGTHTGTATDTTSNPSHRKMSERQDSSRKGNLR